MHATRLKTAFGALALAVPIVMTPMASADSLLGVRIGADVGVSLGGHDHPHYVHDGYEAGYWYAYERPRYRGHWHARYRGFDCHDAFQFSYYDGRRAKFEATMCYRDDGGDGYFIVAGSRHVVGYYD